MMFIFEYDHMRDINSLRNELQTGGLAINRVANLRFYINLLRYIFYFSLHTERSDNHNNYAHVFFSQNNFLRRF